MKAEIVSFDEFTKIREGKNLGKIVATSGGFDPVHSGHLYYISEAKKLADTMVVIVNGDNFLRAKKGKPFINHAERCDIMSHVKSVDYVIPYETITNHTCNEALNKLKPHIFAKSGDRVNKETIPEWDTCVKNNIDIIIVPPAPTDDVHSSNYLKRWVKLSIREKIIRIVPYNVWYHFIATKTPQSIKNLFKKKA